MADEPTLRDTLVARLMQDYGTGWQPGEGYHSAIQTDPSGVLPRVNIAVDSWKTPNTNVRIWLFDPRTSRAHRVRHFEVTDLEDIERTMHDIHTAIGRHAPPSR